VGTALRAFAHPTPAYGGAKHAFTNTAADSLPMPGFGYSPSADARSWLAMQNFSAEIFGAL